VSAVVPGDIETVLTMQARLVEERAWHMDEIRIESAVGRANEEADPVAARKRRKLRCAVLAACSHEHRIEDGIGRLFDKAAALGDEWLADVLDHCPWEALPRKDRPRRPAGGWGGGYKPPIDRARD